MRKSFFLLSAVLAFILFSVPTFADGGLDIAVNNTGCAAGQTAYVTVGVTGNPGISNLSLDVSCDSALTVSGAENGSVLSDMSSGTGYTWSVPADSVSDGTLVTLSVSVPADAERRDYTISLTVSECKNSGGDDVPYSVSSGVLTVSCPHANTTDAEATEATCQNVGYTAGVRCADCGEYISGHTEIPRKNTHIYDGYTAVDGLKHKRVCTVCGYVFLSEHLWSNATVTTLPTHYTEGVRTYMCVCGATREETVPEDNTHTYGEWTNSDTEKHKKTCGCGDTRYENHKWDGGTVVSRPTCAKEGVTELRCTVCGGTKRVSIPAVQTHSYYEYTVIDGYTHRSICSVCGHTEDKEHIWDTGNVTVQPTYDTAGQRTYLCVYCGAERTEDIPKLDHAHEYGAEYKYDSSNHWTECACGDKDGISAHTFGGGVTVRAATCVENGITEYACTVCGFTKTETFTGEHVIGELTLTREASCTADGEKQRVCTVCGEVLYTEAIAAAGHTYGDWTNKDGTITRVCFCGREDIRVTEDKPLAFTSPDGTVTVITESASLPDGTSVSAEKLTLTDGEISDITGAVKLVVKNSDDGAEIIAVYGISLEYEGSGIQPGGGVRVELALPAAEGNSYDGYKVVYIDGNGVAHDMSAELSGDKLIFTAEHFSRYAVAGITEAEEVPPANKGKPVEPMALLVIFGTAAIGVITVIAVIIDRKRGSGYRR